MLVATRHVLATDFRKGFFTHIDILLDERYGALGPLCKALPYNCELQT